MVTVITADQPPATYSHTSLWLIAICFVFSGATGLVYEVLWARMLGLVFGATTLAISTVLAAFMGGLALGSVVAGRLGARIRRPVRAYGLLEIGIALYAISVPFLFSRVDNLYALIWQQFQPGFFVFSLWRFVLSCLMLLIPTALMGATLPVLSAALLGSSKFRSTSVARLYTCNLFGAICGTIAAGFFLLPMIGIRATIYTAAAVNLVIGVVAILADRLGKAEGPACSLNDWSKAFSQTASESARSTEEKFGGRSLWLFCAFVSGFVTISTQVAWTRILTMIIGSSTYAFSIVVALFLMGLSGGAYVIGHKDYSQRLRSTLLKLEAATGLSIFLSLFMANQIPGLLASVGLRLHIHSWAGLLILQILSASLLILLPAFLMGCVMPLVLVWASHSHSAVSIQLVGRSYAMNTMGAIAGAFIAGFILIPRTSTRTTVLIAATLCLVVVGFVYKPERQVKDPDLRRSLFIGATAISIVMLFALSPRMNASDLSIGAYDSLVRVLAKTHEPIKNDGSASNGPETHELLLYEEGATSTVSVRRDWGVTSLAINGRTNASDSEDMTTQVMLAQLPLLIASRLDDALIVGFASGVTVGAMLQSAVKSLECVELERATVKASRFFEHVNNQPLNDPRLHLIIDDARTYLRVTPKRYDIIVSEPSHPWVPGVANLFTEEFFQLGRAHLNDSGLFVQWLQIYQLSTESLRTVLATYQKVFPHVMVFRVGGATRGKDLILVGSRVPLTLDRLRERMSDSRMAAELARLGMKTTEDLESWYICDETLLAPAVAGAVINTDDNMHIETVVPREAFKPLMQDNAAWIEMLAAK